MKPDRVIIGSDDQSALELMKQLYRPFFRLNFDRIITMDVRSAEMTKYVANAMLATKISFMNEIANICERVGADVNQVRIGIGSDSRIGYSFIYPGVGYGGSCFPKDVKALVQTASEHGYDSQLIKAVESVNKLQKTVLVSKIVKRFGEDLSGYCFGVWGLSFKPGTDDMREAPSIEVIKALIDRGAQVKAFDPKSMEEAQTHYLNSYEVEYNESKYDALKEVDAMILLTEWKTFRAPDLDLMKQLMKSPIVFDGRNQYNEIELQQAGFEYYQIGKA
jgi:UDPglucose 6-dehydrogenase